jgi:ketosteroid isomerase-like protein
MAGNLAIVKEIYANFAKGDVGAVLGAFAPDIAWREADGFLFADGNPYIGPAAVASGVFQRCVTMVNSFAAVPANFIDGGETIVAEGRYTGAWAASGKPLNAQFAHVWTLRGGKVVKFQQYTDTRQWAVLAGG